MSGRLCAPLTFLAVAALLFSVIALVVRMRPLSNLFGLVVAVGSPYVALVAVAGLVLAALCGRVLLSIIAVLIVVATVAVQMNWYYIGHSAEVGQHAVVRLLSSNLRKGHADAAFFVETAKATADVITVSELTPEAAQTFSRAGIDQAFPHSVLHPQRGGGGIGLWSRYPLSPASPPPRTDITVVAGRVQIPGVRFEPIVVSVHVIAPVSGEPGSFGQWRDGITAAKNELNRFADMAGSGAVLVGGDFNSTPDMRQFRDLLTHGYRDAVEQTGAGFHPTFPADTWHAPLITIDHVLTRNAAASSIKTVSIPGSDHRALLATIQVPVDPTAT